MVEFGRRRYLQAVGTTLAAALAGCRTARGDGWRQFRATVARTGSNPDATGPETDATVSWTVRTDGRALSGGVVADGSVYLNGGGLTAVATASGDRQWHAALPFDSGITPTVGDDRVYVADRSVLYAFDAVGGAERWHFGTGRRATNAPGVDGDRVYVGFREVSPPYSATMYALDAASGTVLWRAPVGRGDVLLFAPAVGDGRLVVGKEAVFAVDAHTGERNWRFDRPDARFGTPAVGGDRVYVGSTNDDGTGTVYALDASDGREVWRAGTGRGARTIAFDGDTLYVTSDQVYGLDAADGTERWRHDSDRFPHAPPSVAGETVYLGGLAGEIRALDRADGTVRWRLQTDGTFLSPPSLVGEVAYVSGQNGVAVAVS